MSRRASSPPELPGFEFIDFIGSGGYADVFLYEQASPRRQVAIKIVDTDALESGTASDYTAEANVMAMVSAHPNIVQVFQASVSPDGRPFLVMEYYPNQNFQERARVEQMPVYEVLRVGIQIASAVETAHRAGILHRDIKPANILTSEFNHPGLTDFGIAAVAGQADQSGDGLSIPWSPPEALGEAPTLAQSDVYSLAATLYTMLAGRAPFEVKGGDNKPLAMMNRIERDPVPSIGRADVPPLLERVLAGAMAKDPAARPATAADLARQLQEVESSMTLPVTPLQLRDSGPAARSRVDDDSDATRVKKVTSIEAQSTITRPPSARRQTSPTAVPDTTPRSAGGVTNRPNTISAIPTNPMSDAPARDRRREGLLAEPEVEDTIARSTSDQAELAEYQPPKSVPKMWLWIGGAAAVVVAIVIATQLLGGGNTKQSEGFNQTEADVAQVNDNLSNGVNGASAVAPLPLEEVVGETTTSGSNRFTWEDPGNGVAFAVTADGESYSSEIDTPEFLTSSECIEVEVIAPSGLVSAPTRGCVP